MYVIRKMSSVCDLGTIRSIIRGVDEPSPHTLIAEMIDDAEHSASKSIFIDINTHEKKVIFGFENPATVDQCNKMISWNPSSSVHNTSIIATCGQGLKYYEFRFRGEQIHATKTYDVETKKDNFILSTINSHNIYISAMSPDVSESQFSDILKKNTGYATKSDEIVPTLSNIFNNEDSTYPFKPKTIIISKNIRNDKLMEWLDNDDNIKNLEKELINKYYEEIKTGKLTIFIKFPKCEFRELGSDCNIDIIGSTNKQYTHVTELYCVQENFDKFKKGEYIISINTKFFRIQKMGNSYARTLINLNDSDKSKLLLHFHFIQYNIKDPSTDEELKALKNCIIGTSLEEYCGVYLQIGDKFIDGKPIACSLTKRNLQGSRLYRGVLQLKNPQETKMLLGIHGLKSDFNLSAMSSLEQIIKQCCIIYKNYCVKNNSPSLFTAIDPETYCIVQTSNDKSKRTSKPGHNYVRVIGSNFYKFGMTGKSNRINRIFDILTPKEHDQLKKDFPDEEIFPANRHYYEYLSPLFNSSASMEQKIKEYIMNLQDVITYDHKVGDDVREYFHCDNPDTIAEIKQIMISGLSDE